MSIDLLSIYTSVYIGDRPNASVESFAEYLRDLHIEIRRKIIISYKNYKCNADLRRRLKGFVVGDEVMLRVRP